MWFTLEELRDISKERWKNIVQEKVEMKAEEEIIGRARKMKKMEELCKYEDKLSQKVYLLEQATMPECYSKQGRECYPHKTIIRTTIKKMEIINLVLFAKDVKKI